MAATTTSTAAIEADAAEVEVLEAGQAKPPKGGWKVVTVAGEEFEYRKPKPVASVFLAAAASPRTAAGGRVQAILDFLHHVLSPASYERVVELGNDHDADFDMPELTELMKLAAEDAGDARPTVRSAPSPKRSRSAGPRSVRA